MHILRVFLGALAITLSVSADTPEPLIGSWTCYETFEVRTRDDPNNKTLVRAGRPVKQVMIAEDNTWIETRLFRDCLPEHMDVSCVLRTEYQLEFSGDSIFFVSAERELVEAIRNGIPLTENEFQILRDHFLIAIGGSWSSDFRRKLAETIEATPTKWVFEEALWTYSCDRAVVITS